MPLDVELGHWLEAPRHVGYAFYRTAQWTYQQDEVEPGKPIFTRFRQLTDYTNLYCLDEEVSKIPAHAHPVSAYVKHTRLYLLQDYCLIAAPLSSGTGEGLVESHQQEMIHSATQTVTAVSDGSLDPITGRMAYAWTLAIAE